MGAQAQVALAKLPVIDFSKESLKCGTSCWSSTAIDVRHALEQYGCFVAQYDKVSLQLHNSILREVKELFDLPTEIKMKNISDKPYFGYAGYSSATPHVPPLHESMGIENSTALEPIQSFTNLMWPDAGNHHFCETVVSYTKLVAELERMVKRMVFESYGAVEKYYDSHVGSTTYLFRPIKYRVPEINESSVGCHIHTDKSFITILHQNEVEGFELKTKDGHWIGFEPSPSSFLVLAGDAFLAWSNDRIHSVEHRVVMKGSRERYSVGVFSYHNGIIEIPEEVVDEQHPLKFKPFENFGLLNYFYTAPGPKTDSTAKAYCGL